MEYDALGTLRMDIDLREPLKMWQHVSYQNALSPTKRCTYLSR